MSPIHGIPSSYIVILGVVVVVALRMRRLSRLRPMKLERLWVIPALLFVATVATLASAPPKGLDWAWIALGVVLGGGFGWMRAKTMHIEVDPVTHAVSAKGSQAAMVFIVVLVAVRFGLRTYMAANASALHVNLATLSDAFIAFALGLVCLSRVEMAIRANRLLHQARAAGVTAVVAEG